MLRPTSSCPVGKLVPLQGGAALTVYLDLVMLLNFLVDLLLLLGTNRLAGYPTGLTRCALAAAFGALYSGVCMFPEFRFLGNTLWRVVSLCLMAMLSFGMNSSAVRRGGIFVILSMALGGIALHLGSSDFLPLVFCGAVLLWLCRIGFSDPPGGRSYVPVAICHNGKTVRMMALRDTGNTLRDPITGEQVLVVSTHIARQLTGLTLQQLRSPLETLAAKPVSGLRLIPYRAVGSSGMLLGMRFENVTIDGKLRSAVAAFAAEDFGRGESYQALAGGIL